jgi:beta-aspartyl-peptidase (threonine type)
MLTADAGVGSVLNTDGLVDLGTVAAVQNIRHPISLAKQKAESRKQNPACCLLSTACCLPLSAFCLLALDRDGNLAAGTSTGGWSFKRPGRVGDSPLVGCGFYADNLRGAASSTGDGEAILLACTRPGHLHLTLSIATLHSHSGLCTGNGPLLISLLQGNVW